MVMNFCEISCLPEFEKDLKKLLKRFKTLEEDLRVFIEVQLTLYHKQKIDNKGIFRISGVQIETPKLYIAKKFACRSLKGTAAKSGIRIVYAYYEEEDKIELVEIYYKSDKEKEDLDRILKYYKK
jgi:mRNA-degrading endonuclease RelE of RelBE toxin-antitoxin system